MSELEREIVSKQVDSYGSYLKIKDNPRYRKARRYILENSTGNESVLDIGCANGDFLEELVTRGYDCHGLEIVDEAIEEATQKGIKVRKGSFLEDLPYDNGFFDFVFAGEVIEHTLDDHRFLQEVNRVLRSGGTLILTTPNLLSLGNRLLMLLGRMPRFAYADFHYQIYNPRTVSMKVKDAGFEVARLASSYILISTFYSRVLGKVGERLGSIAPHLGEHIIVFARKVA